MTWMILDAGRKGSRGRRLLLAERFVRLRRCPAAVGQAARAALQVSVELGPQLLQLARQRRSLASEILVLALELSHLLFCTYKSGELRTRSDGALHALTKAANLLQLPLSAFGGGDAIALALFLQLGRVGVQGVPRLHDFTEVDDGALAAAICAEGYRRSVGSDEGSGRRGGRERRRCHLLAVSARERRGDALEGATVI